MATLKPSEHDLPLLPIQPKAKNGSNNEPSISNSKTDAESFVSKWGSSWKTTSPMVAFYVLALATALSHLGMFLTLDGKLTDDDRIPSQTYIATISTFLVNIFGTSLGVSLGIASTQYVWHLLRTRPMAVETVEDILRVRKDPLLLFNFSLWTATPMACIITIFILLLAVAKAFPPGALTIVTRDFITKADIIVPTFKANETINYNTLCANGVLQSMWTCVSVNPAAKKIAFATLATGEVLSSPSACGSNCTYDIVFEGPQFNCTKRSEVTLQSETSDFKSKYYSGGIWDLPNGKIPRDGPNRTAIYPSFFLNVSSPIGWMSKQLVVNTTYLECQPEVVTYELGVGFNDGIRNLSLVKRNDARSLTKLFSPYIGPPENSSVAWSPEQLNTLTATNIYAIIASMIKPLVGVYPMVVYGKPERNDTIALGNGTTITYEVGGYPVYHFTNGLSLEAMNGTIIDKTYLNKNRDSVSVDAVPEVDLSANVLNEALANVTLSMLFALPFWNTTVETTRATSRNFYTFSHPAYLYVPYGASLIIAIPFLALGMIALVQNGTAAIDGGWLQILMTTTASQRLRTAAAAGYLGGEDNIPKELKKMKVMFGEVQSGPGEEAAVRRVGFGFADETSSFNRRVKYGVASE